MSRTGLAKGRSYDTEQGQTKIMQKSLTVQQYLTTGACRVLLPTSCQEIEAGQEEEQATQSHIEPTCTPAQTQCTLSMASHKAMCGDSRSHAELA